jgi:hypothetical protein
VKSRGYALGLVFLFLFCALFPRRRERPFAMAAALVLLAWTSALGIIVACAAVVAVVLPDALAARGRDRRPIAALAVAVAGIALSVLALWPPADAGYDSPWLLGLDVEQLGLVVSRIAHALVPLPGHLHYRIVTAWDAWLAVLVAGASLALVARRPAARRFWVAGTGGLLAFFYTKYTGLIWHHGYLHLVWFAALWLARRIEPVERRPARLDRALVRLERWQIPIVALVLAVHVATGALAWVRDLREPYSAGQAAARFIEREGLDRLLIVGYPDYRSVSVLGYLPPGLHVMFSEGERRGSFVHWDRQRLTRPADEMALLVWAVTLARERGEDVLLVLGDRLTVELPPFVLRLAAFDESIWPDERFYLYRIVTAPPSRE